MDRLQIVAAAVMIAGLGGIAVARQTETPQPLAQGGTATAATKAATTHRRAKPSAVKKTTGVRPAMQRIPMETVPATTPSPRSAAQEARQRAADQQLLEQQQAQSAAAAATTNGVVRTAQRQQDKVQSETRIQDAPGPAQTGVVPAAGPPVVPAATSRDIQEAPGPAQTLAPAPARPAAAPAPATPPPPLG